MDFFIALLIFSPFIVVLLNGKTIARKVDAWNRKKHIEHQLLMGKRDGTLTREVVEDMQRRGEL